MSGYVLHPGALTDIDEIAAYIGQDSLPAAHRVVDEIYRAIQNVVLFPPAAIAARISPTAHCASSACGTI